MKLRDVGFTFGFADWAVDGDIHHQSLSHKSWSIFVYIQQRLTKAKINTDGITGIWFAPVQERTLLPVVQRGSNLIVDVRINWDHFAALETCNEVNGLFCDLYEQGLDRIEQERGLPVDFLRDTICEFRDGHYENRWTFKTKVFRAKKTKAQLDCVMNTQSFRLILIIWQHEKEVFRDVILETDPDPFFFYYQFKDVLLKDGVVSVQRRKPQLTDSGQDPTPLFAWELEAK